MLGGGDDHRDEACRKNRIAIGKIGTMVTNATNRTSSSTRSSATDANDLLEKARAATELLKAFAHETRLVILCALIDGEKSVSELEQLLNQRQPAVSQQLARLRADDLVEVRRDGKNIYYSLARPEVREVIAVLHRIFCQPGRR
jgi:DNA-binding transcriptional ArsR family regulator